MTTVMLPQIQEALFNHLVIFGDIRSSNLMEYPLKMTFERLCGNAEIMTKLFKITHRLCCEQVTDGTIKTFTTKSQKGKYGVNKMNSVLLGIVHTVMA